MRGLLIANKDSRARNRLAELFDGDDYQVSTADSVANALEGIINKEIQVVVLDGQVDQQNMARLVPLLKKCNRHLSIILISDELPLELMRRVRQEGIFYHALRTTGAVDPQEVRAAVRSAFTKYEDVTATGASRTNKERIMFNAKSLLSSLAVMLLLVSPAFAVDTAVTYSSGLLVLLFVGFCALIIVAQLVPAILVLFGMTKAVTQSSRRAATAKN